MIQPEKQQMAVHCMHFVCWLTMATGTHSEYVVVVVEVVVVVIVVVVKEEKAIGSIVDPVSPCCLSEAKILRQVCVSY